MKILDLDFHACMDYAIGALLLVSPWLFGFSQEGNASLIMLAMGNVLILYGMMTDFDFSLIAIIPFEVHLGLDIAFGVLLMASPWIFDFAAQIYMPQVVMGLATITVAIFTQDTRPDFKLPRASRLQNADS